MAGGSTKKMVVSMRSVGLALIMLTLPCGDAFAPVGSVPMPLRRPRGSVAVMMAKGKSAGAKVQVLLNEAVEGLGKANEVVQVTPAYFSNVLRPKNKAKMISDDEVKVKEAKEEEERETIKQDAISMGTEIEKICPIVLKRKTGKGNNIFGTITHKQVADAIVAQTGGKVKFTQKMKWTMPEVQGLGEFACEVQLHPEVSQKVKVDVQPEK